MIYVTLTTFIDIFNSNGYVCNFSDWTFGNFTIKIVGFNLKQKYGKSKFSSLCSFIADQKIKSKDKYNLLKALLQYHKVTCIKCELNKNRFSKECEQKEKELNLLFPNLSLNGDFQAEKTESLIEIHGTSYWIQQIKTLNNLNK